VVQDIEIVFTGLRQGDKLHEEPLVQSDESVGTTHRRILRLRNDNDCEGTQRSAGITQGVAELVELARAGDRR
jgi:FlaA1/EpsC-like NDP-sugar epimerase